MFPIILYIFIGIIGLYIGLERPDITYKGNRSVPKEDVVHYGKITLRDLRMDKYTKYEGSSLFLKYYIVKKNHLSKRILRNGKFSCKLVFDSYEECSTMPWFWNNDGYFPDLEMNSQNLIAVYWITKDGLAFRKEYKVVYTADDNDTDSKQEKKEKGYTLPEYVFTVACGGGKSAESGQLDVRGWIRTKFTDKRTRKPLANKKYTIYLSDGTEINGTTDDEGYVEHKDLKMGEYSIEFKE